MSNMVRYKTLHKLKFCKNLLLPRLPHSSSVPMYYSHLTSVWLRLQILELKVLSSNPSSTYQWLSNLRQIRSTSVKLEITTYIRVGEK